MEKPSILIAAENGMFCPAFSARMRVLGWMVRETRNASGAAQSLRNGGFDMVIVDSSAGNSEDSLNLIREIRETDSAVPILLVTRFSTEDRVIAAFRAGATDYFKQPFSPGELLEGVRRNLRTRLAPSKTERDTVQAMAGKSRSMRALKSYLAKVATVDSTVLITGESGTGKELAASLIHRAGARRNRPFVCVNCAALPESLIESEMFGYERGSFTGAVASSRGRFELAEGGTVFLDEIADMSAHAQAKILRVVENKEVHRLGGKKGVSLNIRIMAATNQHPERLVREGKFREDLYYRLNVARIHLPPLRERKEDIRNLVDLTLAELNRRFDRRVEGLSKEALESLLRYDWPGNVRELKNTLEATFIALPSLRIEYEHLPPFFRMRLEQGSALPADERDRVLSALRETNWNKSKAAQKLNWSRMTLYRKMAKHRIDLRKTNLREVHGDRIFARPEPKVEQDVSGL